MTVRWRSYVERAYHTGRYPAALLFEAEMVADEEYRSWLPRDIREPGNVEYESWEAQ